MIGRTVHPTRGVCGVVVFALAVSITLGAPGPAQGFGRVAELERLLKEGPDDRIRVQAAFSLGRAGERRARRALERALDRDEHPAVRAAAAAALARLGDEAAVPALQRAVRDRTASVRSAAETAIVSLRGSPDRPTRWEESRY